MLLKAGSTILVPKTEAVLSAPSIETEITPELANNARLAVTPDVPDTKRIYVKAGKRDTLNSIANRYRVSVAQIKQWNGLQRDTLANGQSLQLQVPYQAAAAAPARPRQIVHAPPQPIRKAPVTKTTHAAPARKTTLLASDRGTRKQ